MSDSGGVALIVVGAAVALVTAFPIRTRAPGPLVVALLAAAGAALGLGAVAVQDRVSVGEWIAATAVMAVLVPAHVRVVLGPFGPRRAERPA